MIGLMVGTMVVGGGFAQGQAGGFCIMNATVSKLTDLDIAIQYLNYQVGEGARPDERRVCRVDDDALVCGMPARDFYRAVRGGMGLKVVEQ